MTDPRGEAMQPPILDVTSTKSTAELGLAVEAAVAAHGFTVLGMHDLGAKLREKGQAYEGDCRVYDVCNARQAARVLAERPDVSTALPCRISVSTDADGKTHAATILPSSLLGMFDAPALAEVGVEVEQVLAAIIHDAVG